MNKWLSESNRVIIQAKKSSSILIIQTDLIIGFRCCVKRVCVDAVTGSWSTLDVCLYQCHIRASAGRDRVMSVGLDLMISPGV